MQKKHHPAPVIAAHDLDWNRMWQQARDKKTWRSKTSADWDKKADSFARRTRDSVYVNLFLDHLAPDPGWTVLDMGCGPGTLALPLAALVRQVVAVDFSPGMLAILTRQMQERQVTNITPILGGWDDDWERLGIPQVDVAMASRSLAVRDLQAALTKLIRHARQRVVLTDRVDHGPLDPDAFAAVGRSLEVGPDYIYTFNLIHQMGYLPSVDYLSLERELCFSSRQELMDSYLWMFKELTDSERRKLETYLDGITEPGPDNTLILRRAHPPVWALISWNPNQRRTMGGHARGPHHRGGEQCGS